MEITLNKEEVSLRDKALATITIVNYYPWQLQEWTGHPKDHFETDFLLWKLLNNISYTEEEKSL